MSSSGGCAPVVSLLLGARIRTSHPSGSRPDGAGDGSVQPLALFSCPQKIFGSKSCPSIKDSRKAVPRRRERQHLWGSRPGRIPKRAQKR
jgi:hypothetical protein